MSREERLVVLAVAVAGQVCLGKVAKQQAAALGLSVMAVGLVAAAIGAVLG